MVRTTLTFCLFYIFSFLQAQNTPCPSSRLEFDAPKKEKGCMAQFDIEAKGNNPINIFLLAKMTELIYPERLDFQYRFLNDSLVSDTLISTSWLLEHPIITEENFECAFEQRFRHFFDEKTQVEFQFIRASFVGRAKGLLKAGFDPELMLISTPKAIFIIFRGTDSVGDKKLAEWTGTDFKVALTKGDGPLEGIKLHQGFWGSFALVKDELMMALDQMNAKQKKIWISGHSLGGAMSILSGAYLAGENYPIQNIYTFASPRAIGGKKFKEKVEELLPEKIQRFEFFLDPIPLLWVPPYKNNGNRNWYQDEAHDYVFHEKVEERYVASNPTEFNRIPFIDKRKKEDVKLKREKLSALVTDYKTRMHYHNPQWYVKAAYAQLSEEEKKNLPSVDDSFPFLYYGAKFGR